MDDLDNGGGGGGGPGDDSKRKTRNASEKKRRDQFNILVTELGTMVSPNNRKMDKTTVLKSTIAFLKQHNESSVKSQVHEIQEDWKPSFLSNEEFTHLMLEALEGFILVFSTDGSVVYASESITSLLGYLPSEVTSLSIYEMVSEADKPSLYNSLMASNVEAAGDSELNFFLHMKRGGQTLKALSEEAAAADPAPGDEEDGDSGDAGAAVTKPKTELVKLSGYFRKWTLTDANNGENSDDEENASVKSGFSRFSAQDSVAPPEEKTVFVSTARLQTSQLLRDIPLIHASSKNEFTSRYSLEWKFLFLDHRAPQIIGYLSFELLGTSGYDYYHFDDLDRISECHEALMQTGEGTSCYHRFLSKGQQWIWLQTRYFITYHQWNSKPEFVVATHKVVNYTDVIKDLRGSSSAERRGNKSNGSHRRHHDNNDESEAGSDLKSHLYPTTGSPTCSSRSSIFGGSSTGTGVSSRVSERQHNKYNNNYNDTASSGQGEDFFPGTEFDSISQYIHPPPRKSRHSRRHHREREQQQQHYPSNHLNQQQQQQQLQSDNEARFLPENYNSFSPSVPASPAVSAAAAPAAAAVVSQPQILISPSVSSSAVVLANSNQSQGVVVSPTIDGGLRPQVVMTPAQVQLQEQLRMKHTELTKRIADQQEELRRISEQLLMSQYGLVPVNVTFPAMIGGSPADGTAGAGGGGNSQASPAYVQVAGNAAAAGSPFPVMSQAGSVPALQAAAATNGYQFQPQNQLASNGQQQPQQQQQPRPQIVYTSISNTGMVDSFRTNGGGNDL